MTNITDAIQALNGNDQTQQIQAAEFILNNVRVPTTAIELLGIEEEVIDADVE